MACARPPHPEERSQSASRRTHAADPTPSPLLPEGLARDPAEQREMRVAGDPVLADPPPRQRHRGAAGPVIGLAVLMEARRIPDCHARGGEAVGRDDAAEAVLAPA